LATWPQALNIAIDNVSIWSNHPVQYFMRCQGAITGIISDSGLHGNGNKMIKALSNVSGSAVATGNSAF
jgi:hypothetical protein